MTAGIPSLHSFLMELQTGSLGPAIKHELGFVGTRSNNNSQSGGGKDSGSNKPQNRKRASNNKKNSSFLSRSRRRSNLVPHELDSINGDGDKGSVSPSLSATSAPNAPPSNSSQQELVSRPHTSSGGTNKAGTATTVLAGAGRPTSGLSGNAPNMERTTSIFATTSSSHHLHHHHHGSRSGGGAAREGSFIDDDSDTDEVPPMPAGASGGAGASTSAFAVYQKTSIYVHEEPASPSGVGIVQPVQSSAVGGPAAKKSGIRFGGITRQT